MSFRFLNPRLVDDYPRHPSDVCYRGIRGDPDVLCGDIPPNQWRFLGCWYLTPERHFREWMGFVVVGVLIVAALGPKVSPKQSSPSESAAYNNTALAPRPWMIASSLLLYPYVVYTKLSWQDSYYSGRWLLIVGMPVGTIWILSVLHCSTFFFGVLEGPYRRQSGVNRCCVNEHLQYKIRYWLLETWFSSLPMIVDLMPGLFGIAISSISQSLHGITSQSGHDGDNAYITYFFHVFYLVLVPVYYYVWTDELSPQQHPTRNDTRIGRMGTLALDAVLRQLVGTAICAIYYMGIMTPVSIVAGLNVNLLLMEYSGRQHNFRMFRTLEWFARGCVIRILQGVAKVFRETAMLANAKRNSGGDGDNNDDNIGGVQKNNHNNIDKIL